MIIYFAGNAGFYTRLMKWIKRGMNRRLFSYYEISPSSNPRRRNGRIKEWYWLIRINKRNI